MHSTAMSNGRKLALAWLIYLTVIITGLCTDIYTPSLPSLSHYMNVSQGYAKNSVTLYIVALGVFQPLIGPFCDRYGRRWILSGGLFLCALTMLFAALSVNIIFLLVMRFLQGFAVACAVVPARAMINDVYEGKQFKKVASTITVVWALGPLIAPYIGGYIQQAFDWQGNFFALMIYTGLAAIASLFILKETLVQSSPLALTKVLKAYLGFLRHREFMLGTGLLALGYSQLVIFGVIGSFLVQQGLHLSAVVFGRSAMMIGLGWLIGNMANRFLIDTNAHKKVRFSITLGIIAAFTLLVFAIIGLFNLYSLIIPVILMALAASILYPIGFSNTLAIFPEHAAKASALMVGLIMVFTGVLTTLCSSFHQLNLLPISISYLVIWCLITLITKQLFPKQR